MSKKFYCDSCGKELDKNLLYTIYSEEVVIRRKNIPGDYVVYGFEDFRNIDVCNDCRIKINKETSKLAKEFHEKIREIIKKHLAH